MWKGGSGSTVGDPISVGARRYAPILLVEFPDRCFCRQAAYIGDNYSELEVPKMKKMRSNSIWGPTGGPWVPMGNPWGQWGAHGSPRAAHRTAWRAPWGHMGTQGAPMGLMGKPWTPMRKPYI